MKINKTIRVILADDHPAVRRGIRRMLEKVSNILVVGEAASGVAALQLVHELTPDVLVLDIEMPDMKGHQVAQILRESKFPVSILVLSSCDEDHFIREIVQGGVDGYLYKGETAEKIRQAVFRVSGKYTEPLIN